MIYKSLSKKYSKTILLASVLLGVSTTAAAGPAPSGVFFLQGVGSATVAFSGVGCQAGIPGSNVAQINDLDAVIAPPDGAGDSVINLFVAWADPSTNGSAAGNFKYDFVADNISEIGFMAGIGVVSNAIPVEGTGTAPLIPIQGFFTGGSIDVPGPLNTIVFNNLSFKLDISLNCKVDITMNGTLVLIFGGGTEEQPPSQVLQAPQLAEFGQTVQTFIPKVVKRPGAPTGGSPSTTPSTPELTFDRIYIAPDNFCMAR